MCVYIYICIYTVYAHTHLEKKERCFLRVFCRVSVFVCTVIEIASKQSQIPLETLNSSNTALHFFCVAAFESLIISHIMATVRKLQAEIDKTFRKVDEQQEVFQQVFDRLHECDQSLKEKYEVLLLAYMRRLCAFFPRNWNAQLFCHDARVDLSLSLSLSRPTFYCDVFLCRDDEAWWSSSLGAFFLSAPLRVLEHCVLRANTSALCSASQFQTNGKRGISL